MKTKGLARIRIVGILILGGLTIAAWQLLLAPRFTEPLEVGTRTEEALNRLASLEEQISSLEERASGLGDVQARADELAVLLPPTAEVPQLVLYIDQAAARAGMSPSQVSTVQAGAPSQPAGTAAPAADAAADPAAPDASADEPAAPAAPSGDAPYTMTVTITAVGTWQELMAFVSELQTAERALILKSIDMTEEAGTPGQFKIVIQAEALVVRALGPAPAPPGGAPAPAPTATPAPAPSGTPAPTGSPTPGATQTPTPAPTATPSG